MRLFVTRSLKPAIFSMARLLKKPTSPVPNPMRRASVHLRTTYWNISAFFRDLQSCFKSSFSAILQKYIDTSGSECSSNRALLPEQMAYCLELLTIYLRLNYYEYFWTLIMSFPLQYPYLKHFSISILSKESTKAPVNILRLLKG